MKKIIGFILVLFLLLIPNFSNAIRFSDVSYSHWAFDSIDNLSDLGIFGGYEDGTFQPEKYVSNLEIFSILQRMSAATDEDVERAIGMYGDVSDRYNISEWAKPGVSLALYKNIVYESELKKAFENGTLTDIPEDDSDFPTREEIAVYFGRFLEVAPSFNHENLEYEDLDTIGNAVANDLSISDYLSPLVDAGIFDSEGSEGYFEPTRPFRRAEMANIVDSSLNYLNEANEDVEEEIE